MEDVAYRLVLYASLSYLPCATQGHLPRGGGTALLHQLVIKKTTKQNKEYLTDIPSGRSDGGVQLRWPPSQVC